MWRTRRWWRKVDERCRVAPKSRTEHAEKLAAPPPRPLQPNALLDPRMALMCTVRRARRRRRPRAKSPRLLARGCSRRSQLPQRPHRRRIKAPSYLISTVGCWPCVWPCGLWLVRPRGTRAGGDAMDEDEGPLTQEEASAVRTAPQRTYVDALSCDTWGGNDPPSSDGGWSPG